MDVTPVFNSKKVDPGNYRLVSLTLIPGKVREQQVLETISRHTKGKQVVCSSQHGFTKEKAYLSNVITFYNEGLA